MNELVHSAFFGDGEKQFLLSHDLVIELERKTGTGIGSISRRFYSGDFKLSELLHVSRLALIGGGSDPEEADALVTTFAPRMSVTKLYELLLPVMDLLMFGKASTDEQ
ncbi:gene transfer agent family protein [Rhizobium laguerreae]|uniref:gene transfer agent family protein n=1 Tax=Rhizobium laguerreae TaxID=1076926 RepID=UPI00143F4803|nr:gene transfer agent family protein [Rhizobium laguerreae]NKM86359.1 gene transfer agent family protein [Rhizobium laguerreae]